MIRELKFEVKLKYFLIYFGLVSLGIFIPLKISLGVSADVFLAITDLILSLTLISHKNFHKKENDYKSDPFYFMSHKTKDHSRFYSFLHSVSLVPFETIIFCLSFIFPVPEFVRLISFFRIFQVVDFYHMISWLPKYVKIFLVVSFLCVLTHWVANGWILIEPHLKGSRLDRYITAMYWTVTTLATVGYGDVAPVTNLGRIYAMFVMMIGVSGFAMVVSNFSRILIQSDKRKEEKKNKLKNLHSLLSSYQVPHELQTEVYNFYSHFIDQKSMEDEDKILADLPLALRLEMTLFMRIHFIKDLHIFKGLSQHSLKQVAECLEERFYSVNDYITKVGELGIEMYIVSSGEVEVEKNNKIIANLKEGQIFGEMALFEKNMRSANIKAKTYTNIWALSKENFEKICLNNYELSKRFKEIYQERMSKNAIVKT